MKKEWSRGVSIIGAAYTPFGNVLETPEIKGMTYRELISWAVLEALESAGITPKDIDSLLVANYQPEPIKTHCIHAVAADWLGLRKKPSVTFETACVGGITGIRLAGSLIASGIDDIVVVVATEILNSIIDETPEYRKHPAARKSIDFMEQLENVYTGFDQAYLQPLALDFGGANFVAQAYVKKYGLTLEQLDETNNATAISMRRNAARNPRAFKRQEYAEIAREAGFSDVMSYMKSSYNPSIAWMVRIAHTYPTADGAAALVLCPADDAKRYTQNPVDITGVGIAAGLNYEADQLNRSTEWSAFKQAYKMADLNPEEIDYLALHDCFIQQHFCVSEMAGYFQPGEAWKAIIEGRTAFDGDKPISTHGSCLSMGNAYDASGVAEIAETVLQMRGECDQRQINPRPKCSVVHATGAGSTFGVTVLRGRG
jgi:acetyl-CoA C-acetyltransferase